MEKNVISEDIVVAASQNIKERDYWLKKLSGQFGKCHFPYDQIRFDTKSGAFDQLGFTFSEHLFSKLMQVSSGVDYSLHVILVAGIILLLDKYTGEKDIILGTSIFKQEIEGDFINTVLALRIGLNSNMNFKDLLLQVKQTVIEATENQNYPYETLLYKLNLPSDTPDSCPLFDVVVLLENIHDRRYLRHIKPNIFFLFNRNSQSITAAVEYNSYLYQNESIQRIFTHLSHLLQAALADLDSPLFHFSLIPGDEQKEILFDFNNTRKEFPADETFTRLFDKQVVKEPDRLAAVHNDLHVTYKVLNRQAAEIAQFLSRQGDNPEGENIVAVYMRRSIEMLAAILGIFNVGAVYLPLPVDIPEERVKFMLEDSECQSLISERARLNAVEKISRLLPRLSRDNILYLEITKGCRCRHSGSNLIANISSNSDKVAYMIYTSGTTGNPKGVLIHHRGMINHLYAKINDLSISRDDKVAQTASPGFDISIWQFLTGLVVGGTTVIIDKEVYLEPNMFLKMLQKKKVTIMESVPSLMNQFFELIEPGQDKELNDLRWMIFTGEPLKVNLVRKWFEHYPGIKIVNAYGPTEASDDITHYIMADPPAQNYRSIPIGRPLQNLQVYIFGQNLSLNPVGVIGEVCVAGVGVGKGYWKDPEKTAQCFISNPMMNVIGNGVGDYARLYKTGDLGRWLPDGNIEFFGRKDDQIKIRGYRIELGEIERQMIEIPFIQDAVVIDRQDEKGEKYLCGYVVLSESNEGEKSLDFNTAELREHLKTKLPDAMIPAYFVQLETIPLTPNGKADRKALPEPGTLLPGDEYIAPRNRTEALLVDIWEETLKIEKSRISIDANFFHLGGHSLNATILVAQIHKRLNVKVPLTEVFRIPTIRELACYVTGAKQIPYQSIEKVRKKEYYALSSAQKRLYIVHQMDPQSTNLNVMNFAELRGELDLVRLEETFIKMINRHEGLRTSFVMTEEGPAQKIHEPGEVAFVIEHYDWKKGKWVERENLDNMERVEPAEVDDQKIKKLIADFKRPFDLSRVPLFRVGLVRVSKERRIFLVDVNHIIADGTSLDIFIKDFIALYRGTELPELRLTYKDYSEWQNSKKGRNAFKEQEIYWLNQFEGELPVLNLPTDYDRPEVQSFAGGKLDFELDKQETELLRKIALERDVTLFMVLLASYNVLLFKLSGQEDIIVGTPLAGRSYADLENIIGMFLNVLALRNYPGRDKSFSEFLHDVREKTLTAFENQDYQFEDLVENVLKGRDASRNPLFNVVMILQNFRDESPELKAVERYSSRRFEIVTAVNDLTLYIEETGEVLLFSFEYCSKLFKRSSIERFAQSFKRILKQVVTNPDVILSEIEVEIERDSRDGIEVNKKKIPGNQLEEILDEGTIQSPLSPAALALAYEQVEWHYRMQHREFISKLEIRDWGMFIYSDATTDPLWNHAFITSTANVNSESQISGILKEIRTFADKHWRYPMVCVIAESPGFRFLNEILQKQNYQIHYVESWQVYNPDYPYNDDNDAQLYPLEIKEVETEREMDIFVDIFNQSFLVKHFYMGNALKSYFYLEPSGHVKHFIGFADGIPACVLSLIIGENQYANPYNLGTLPEYRGRGFGKRMMLHMIDEFKKSGGKLLFQQVRYGRSAERMYEEIGYETIAHRIYYVMSDIKFSTTSEEVFWREHLKEAGRPTVLPMKTPSLNINTDMNLHAGDKIWALEKIELSTGLIDKIQRISQEHQLNVFSIVIGAWSLLLSYYSDSEQVLFGINPDIHGEEKKSKESYLPIHLQIEYQSDILSWLGNIQGVYEEIHRYKSVPLFEIHEWSQIQKDQLIFENVLEFSAEDNEERTKTWGSLFPLVCRFIFHKRKVEIKYNCNDYTDGFILGLIDHFVGLLEAIVKGISESKRIQVKNITISHNFLESKSNIITEEQGDFDF